jgi:hypothetical protein
MKRHWPRCRSILRVIKFNPGYASRDLTQPCTDERGLFVVIQASNDLELWHRLLV